METNMMKRRDFLKISALAGVAVVAAACTPTATPTAAPTVASKATEVPKATTAATTAATAVPKATEVLKATEKPKVGFQGEIEFYAQAYTPTSTQPNPDPKAPKHEAMAMLAKEWEDLHPGIKFTFFQAPAGVDYVGWLTTQLIGGTGPDMFFIQLAALNLYADQGKVVPLNDYLELPNKYTPEDKTAWKNTFKSPFITSFSPKGQWGGVPVDLVATGIYCNVDMFKSVGIDLTKEIVPELGSPKDWATLISWCKKLKEAGFFAFFTYSATGEGGAGWIHRVLIDQLFWSLTPTFDKLNYHKETPMTGQEGVVNQEEVIMQYACNNWKPFEEPATRTECEIIKDLTQYMPAGFAGEDMTIGAFDLFLQGQLAMFWDGSWSVGPIMQDDRRKFEFSSFWLPPLTKATTPLAKDPPILPIGVGGYGSLSYGIQRKCIDKGDVDACVDWLMYITTPKNDEKIVNEVPSFIPSNKKAKSLPEVENMFVGETRLVGGATIGHLWPTIAGYSSAPGWFGYADNKFNDTFGREMTLYLLNEQDLDTFMAHLDAGAREEVSETIRSAAIQYSKDGSWDLTQWTCQPTV